jgi:acyl-coenzyme A synthetase/AMP-(fatty) acid ligase
VEVVPEGGLDDQDALDELEEQIRSACEGLVAAARPRRIKFVDEIETRGNKITRGVVDDR